MRKVERETRREIKKAGFSILSHSVGKSHHQYEVERNGRKFKLTVSSTPSCSRGQKNLMAILRRNVC